MATVIPTTTETKKTTKMDMFEQMNDTFKSAFDNGLKLQKDAFRTMFGACTGMETSEDMRCKMERVTNDSIEMARKNAEQGEKLFDAQCRTGMDVMRKTFDAFRNGHGEQADTMEQCRGAWKSGFDAMRTGMDTFAKGQTTLIENWASFLDKAMTTTDKPVAK